jgi:hypothetical protein
MRGEMRRAQKLTFKELEEQIDLERETTAARNKPRGGAIRPAAGNPAALEESANSPRSAPRADLLPPPSRLVRSPSAPDNAAPRQAGSSGNYAAVVPGQHGLPLPPSSAAPGRYSAAPSATGGSGNYAAVQVPPAPASQPAAMSKNLGGTEYMAQSPFAPPPNHGGQPAAKASAGTVLMPQMSEPPPQTRSASKLRTQPLSAHQPPVQPVQQPKQANQANQPVSLRESHQAYPRPSLDKLSVEPPPPQPQHPQPPQPQAVEAPPAKKGGSKLVWVLLLLVLLGGGAYAGWFYRALILGALGQY